MKDTQNAKGKKLKFLALAMIAVIGVSATVGCSNGGDTADANSSSQIAANSSAEENTTAAVQETNEANTESGAEKDADITPDFKETMDSYEKFIDKYIYFMKQYSDSDDITGMLDEYNQLMQEYTDFTKEIDEINEDELSDADLAYYLEVTSRVNEKLAAVE